MDASEHVSFEALKALGRVVRENAEDTQRRRLLSLESPEPDEPRLGRALVIRRGGHEASVSLFAARNGAVVRVWGLDASSLVAGRWERQVPVAGLIRLVREEESGLVLWQAALPPLPLRLASPAAADRLLAALLDMIRRDAESKDATEEEKEKEEEDDECETEEAGVAAAAMAQLCRRCHCGPVSSGEFWESLVRTGWPALVARTLARALSEEKTEEKNSVTALLGRVLRERRLRLARALPELLAPLLRGKKMQCRPERAAALGHDPREGGRVYAAVPGLPRLFLFLECLAQLLAQFPQSFDYGEQLLRLLLAELRRAGTVVSSECLALLAGGGSGVLQEDRRKTEADDEEAEEEEECLEPGCEPWQLRPCPFFFSVDDEEDTGTRPARTTAVADEREQLRATVGRLMRQVAAQDAALRALERSRQEKEAEEEEKKEEEVVAERGPVNAVREAVSAVKDSVREAVRGKDRIKSERAEKEKKIEGDSSPFRVRNPELPPPSASPPPLPSLATAAEVAEALRGALGRRGTLLEGTAEETEKLEAGAASLREMTRQLNAEAQAKRNRWNLF